MPPFMVVAKSPKGKTLKRERWNVPALVSRIGSTEQGIDQNLAGVEIVFVLSRIGKTDCQEGKEFAQGDMPMHRA
jgi:hypothetical protein